MVNIDYLKAAIPLILPGCLLLELLDNPVPVVRRWIEWLFWSPRHAVVDAEMPPVSSQLLAYVVIGIVAFILTNRLVPHIKVNK